MLETILVIVVLLVVAVLIYAATRPSTFRLQRSIVINVLPEQVFPFINNFHHWSAWSPWEKKDLTMKKSHGGPPEGEGAVLEWEGNRDVGTGRMEVLESVPSSKILVKLDFLKPFEAHNRAEFVLVRGAGTTEVRWAMYGPQPYMMKVMGVFCSMDKMVGKDFEDGLASLKAMAEK
ncbi:MAG: SRPBCC family protein [Nitrospira sp.]|nr:SRPBCC family protein [Nitrospira sp.]